VAKQADDTGRGFSAFSVTPSSGVIKGKGRVGLPQTVTVEVMLSPKVGRCRLTLSNPC
jgi:hypothetical protein